MEGSTRSGAIFWRTAAALAVAGDIFHMGWEDRFPSLMNERGWELAWFMVDVSVLCGGLGACLWALWHLRERWSPPQDPPKSGAPTWRALLAWSVLGLAGLTAEQWRPAQAPGLGIIDMAAIAGAGIR